jgi:hypothetical protein
MDTDDVMLPGWESEKDALSALPRDRQARILRTVCERKEKLPSITFPDRDKPR